MSTIYLNNANAVAPNASDDTQSDASAEQNAAVQAGQQPEAASLIRQRILAVQNNDSAQSAQAGSPSQAPADSMPVLPIHAVTNVASPQQAAQVTTMLAGGGDSDIPMGGDNGMIAAQLMLEIGLKTQNNMNKANVAMNMASTQAAMAGIEAQIKQIKADQASTWINLGGSALGAVVPFAAISKGGPNAQVWSPALGQAMPNLFDAVNKNVGFLPGAQSYEAQVDQKNDDLEKTIYNQLAQNGQNVAKSSDSMVDNALRTLSEFFQRITQTLNNIAANV